MPGGDGTGPAGLGSRSGRAVGFCAGYPNPGYVNAGFGRGFGRGQGIGRGRRYYQRYWMHPTPFFRGVNPEVNQEEEKSYLKNMIKELEEEIKSLQNRIQELSKEKN